MKRLSRPSSLMMIGLFLAIAPSMGHAQDVEGSKDHPLFNRLPDYYIDNYDEKDFSVYGEFDYNMNLSRTRAEAVVEVLVSRYSIQPNRLKAHGVGPLVPASSNSSEDGRAKNRRVELVEQ